jgi:hypothetical protein
MYQNLLDLEASEEVVENRITNEEPRTESTFPELEGTNSTRV